MEQKQQYLKAWAERYRRDLTENIMPFWLKYGLDRKHGGVYTCLNRDGSLMDTTKSVWFQGRFGFIAASAYNNIERNEEWLAASKSCIDFILNHCTDENGRMYFEVKEDGTPLRMRRYLFSECFAIIAMAEYSIASGDQSYAQKALEIFRLVQHYADTPGLLAPKYLPALECQGHSLTMILINTASRLRTAIEDPCLTDQIDKSLHALRTYFVHPEFKAVLETVGPKGEFIDSIMGRTINPGHCIETAWFIMEEARHRGWDEDLKQLALQILDWSWDWGWDEEYGGIINFRDCKGLPAQDYSQDMKFWWPQTETIIAMLYAYLATGDDKYLERHQLISDWTYKHFPDAEHGEWYGYLHRDGTVAQPAKGNIFKGPFHIPRMMINSYLLCQAILEKK
ncbi:MAG: AGE family epimerase/isomerase [Prevotellaceae bacterium]|nr:AGE family epimerase/isomerase [Prevotellaceae bacterium]MDY3364487.1 AGE family epimerase/isomerase [Prevotella sp.]